MPNDLLMATNRNKTAAAVCLTLIASATVLSAEPANPIEANNVEPSNVGDHAAYITPDCEFETVTDFRVAAWIKFQELRRQWHEERGARASVAGMAMLPAYQKIMGMGPDVIPLILTQLRYEGDQPDHWFWALAAIADDNPVPPQSRGKVREMAKAWLDWGQKNNYV